MAHAPESDKRIPDIDLGCCVLCDGCHEVAPDVFRMNPAGYMEVVVLDRYPEDLVDEAISKCPRDCIFWS